MEIYTLHRGTAPLFVSLPHDGTKLPADIAARVTPTAQQVPDTDWHVSRLYAFARALGASIIVPNYSRYVVDLNRPLDDVSLYPGQNTTGLCPRVQFSGTPIYLPGREPTPEEIAQRVERYWHPYHAALAQEIARIKVAHGRVMLWEGHSIRSVVPFLFDGRLPDFNLGTAGGASCSPGLQQRLAAVLESQRRYTFAVNGRFKGGYITRRYGRPIDCLEAIQLELSEITYMDEDPPFTLREDLAAGIRPVLRRILEALLAAGAKRYRGAAAVRTAV